MRLQVRFEIAEGADDLIARYNREQQNPNAVLQAVDREQSDVWLKKNAEGYYLQHMLHFYFIWDPRIHHQSPELEWKKKMRGSSFSMSASKVHRAQPARARGPGRRVQQPHVRS